MPSSTLTKLAPGSASLVNLTLQSSSGSTADEGFLSLTMNAAMGSGDTLPDAGDRNLVAIPVSFPLISLEPK